VKLVKVRVPHRFVNPNASQPALITRNSADETKTARTPKIVVLETSLLFASQSHAGRISKSPG
jgi:hypothetical protein